MVKNNLKPRRGVNDCALKLCFERYITKA